MATLDTRIALCMIVKGSDDEADHLKRCLTNISPYVDDIFLNINSKPGHKPSAKVLKVAKSFTENIIITEWHDDFAEARNANLAQAPKWFTHILWLDTDDTIDHPEKIRPVIEASLNYDSIYVDYLYSRDEEGNPLTVHMVARVFKNNGTQSWKGRIHETLIETRGSTRIATKDFMVVHHSEEERKDRSLERNIRMLKMQLEDEGDNPDARTLYYLGCTYIDAGQPENAKVLLNHYLELSGWSQERAAAHTKLGKVFLAEGNRPEAKNHFMQAIGEDPDDPEPQVDMGSLELELKQYPKARKWLEGVISMEKGVSTLERNPMSYTFRTYLLLADVYMGLGGSYLDKALEYARKALKYKKKDKNVREYVKIIEQVVEDKHLTEKVLDVVKKLKKNKETAKIKSLLDSLPKQLDDNPIFVHLRNEESYQWPDKSVAIMCGDSADEEWGPWSLQTGIGGSEEAVIRLSKHLAELGYKVVVFAKPMNNAGMYDGVMWRNFWEANLDDKFDIFIGWRNPMLFDKKIVARKSYLWIHDVIEAGEFTEERLNNLTKVILLSKYHRSLFPLIPDEKILMSGNGIDPDEFLQFDGEVKRDPHKIFYGSSHVRGLAYLYDVWPDVKKAVPDATLDVYYGRGTYDAINAGNPERLKWMDNIQQRGRELDGVEEHGKVSQLEILRHAFESGIWAYPCPFPEVYAITAVKCQGAGAIPVSTDFAALDETVQFGTKVHIPDSGSVGIISDELLEEFKNRLIWWLQHPEEQEKIRPAMMAWARTQSWSKVAAQWQEEFDHAD